MPNDEEQVMNAGTEDRELGEGCCNAGCVLKESVMSAQSAAAPASYLMPTTMESEPTRCSTRASRKPASFIQPMQSAPV
jgi:hypothetical protein